MTEPDAGRSTSAAVSLVANVEEHNLAALSDGDVEHLAQLMTKLWIRSNRFGVWGSVAPLVGCTGVTITLPDYFGQAFVFGWIAFLLGSFTNAIASRLFLRALDLEVESLGYDRATAKAARRAYHAAVRSSFPRFTRARKLAACRIALMRVRHAG